MEARKINTVHSTYKESFLDCTLKQGHSNSKLKGHSKEDLA